MKENMELNKMKSVVCEVLEKIEPGQEIMVVSSQQGLELFAELEEELREEWKEVIFRKLVLPEDYPFQGNNIFFIPSNKKDNQIRVVYKDVPEECN